MNLQFSGKSALTAKAMLAYVFARDTSLTPKQAQTAVLERYGTEIKIDTVRRTLRKLRADARDLGIVETRPNLRSYENPKTLTTFEVALLSASVVVGIATIVSVVWK